MTTPHEPTPHEPTPHEPTKQERLDAIRARNAAKTPGPWSLRETEADFGCGYTEVFVVDGAEVNTSVRADATFIAHAPEDIDYLLALVDERDLTIARAKAKTSELARELAVELERSAALRAELAVVKTDLDGVWLWQDDGHDHLPSLTCPVVMSASRLRSLLSAAALPASVEEAMAGIDADTERREACARSGVSLAEHALNEARSACHRASVASRAGCIRDAVTVAANGLRALAILTAEQEQSR